jgi:ketosteroid isomerase-like protein
MIKKIIVLLSCILMSVSVVSAETKTSHNSEIDKRHTAVDQALDRFHQAAAEANITAYFDLLTDNAIYLGTDATERWTKKQFKSFVEPYFSKGQGWLYQATERHINDVVDGEIVFFEELLMNAKYGQCRGTGVLVKTKQGWKISQYNLSIPLPNVLAKDITGQIITANQLEAAKDFANKGAIQ